MCLPLKGMKSGKNLNQFLSRVFIDRAEKMDQGNASDAFTYKLLNAFAAQQIDERIFQGRRKLARGKGSRNRIKSME